MKYIPLLVFIVGCVGLTSSVDGPYATVTQDGTKWAYDTFTIKGLAPVDTFTIYHQRFQYDDSVRLQSYLRFTKNIPSAGTFDVFAEYADRTNPDSVISYTGNGKIVVSEFKHLVTDFNIRVAPVNDSFLTKPTILFLGHVQR